MSRPPRSTDSQSPISLSSQPTVRHPVFWHADGNFIVRAQNTLFKIHEAVLTINSPELARVLPSRKAELPVYERCPVMIVPEVAEDFADFFSALYDPNYFRNKLGPEPWKEITKAVDATAGVLLIAHRYHFPQQRKLCVDLLKACIPNAGWTELLAMNARNEFFLSDVHTPRKLINLAKAVNVPRFLPFAFYECARSSPAQITTFVDLTGDDRTAVLAGRDIVLQMQRLQIYRSFTTAFRAGPLCQNDPACQQDYGKLKLFDTAITKQVGPLVIMNPDELADSRMCFMCLETARREIRAGQQRLWENLPQMFGLGTWEILWEAENEG